MTDGIGTETYAYNPSRSPASLGAGQLANIDGPLDHDTIPTPTTSWAGSSPGNRRRRECATVHTTASAEWIA